MTRDKFKAKAEEYEKLADPAVDPAEKKRLKDLANTARDLSANSRGID